MNTTMNSLRSTMRTRPLVSVHRFLLVCTDHFNMLACFPPRPLHPSARSIFSAQLQANSNGWVAALLVLEWKIAISSPLFATEWAVRLVRSGSMRGWGRRIPREPLAHAPSHYRGCSSPEHPKASCPLFYYC